MAIVEETFGVLDTHYLTDKELAILLTSCNYRLEQAKELLCPSKGFVVVNMMGKGVPAVLRMCDAGVQLLDDDTAVITHCKSPTTFNDAEDLLATIDNIDVSVDLEKWIASLVHYKYGVNARDVDGWFTKMAHVFETQDITDVVEGRKLRHEDEVLYPIDNL